MENTEVWIVLSEFLDSVADLLPSNRKRQSLTSSLIRAYELDKLCDGVIKEKRATKQELLTFHGDRYVDTLLKPTDTRSDINKHFNEEEVFADSEFIQKLISWESNSNNKKYSTGPNDFGNFSSSEEVSSDESEQISSKHFGLSDDCYIFPFLSEYVRYIAGSSISSANKICSSKSQKRHLVINWYGGRHHAKKNTASGFCYVNDIVISINILRKKFKKVFYLDLDLHHGDGVEEAFKHSNVFTCSVHRYGDSFFPGSGSLKSSSERLINIPVRRGLSDQDFYRIIVNIVLPLIKRFEPDVLVVQCGADGLVTDKYKELNLSIMGYGKAINLLLDSLAKTHIIMLGGGGYDNTGVAKCWTYLTSVALGKRYKQDWDYIPDHRYIEEYEKDSHLFWSYREKPSTRMKNENSDAYLKMVEEYIMNIYDA